MNEKQLIKYLNKLGASEFEIDYLVSNTRKYGVHSLALYRRSNGARKILGYGEPLVIDKLRDVLNRHLSDETPGGFNACPYFYAHLTIGKSK